MQPVVIKKWERRVMYAFTAFVDALQLALDIFVVSEVANHVIDIIVGVILLIYALARRIITVKKSMILLATFGAEQIPFFNALPFWILDMRNLYQGTVSEPAPVIQEEEDAPLNRNGVREPRNIIRLNNNSLNSDGVRRPRQRISDETEYDRYDKAA